MTRIKSRNAKVRHSNQCNAKHRKRYDRREARGPTLKVDKNRDVQTRYADRLNSCRRGAWSPLADSRNMRHDAGPRDAKKDDGEQIDAMRRVLCRCYDECRDAEQPNAKSPEDKSSDRKPRDVKRQDVDTNSIMGWITTGIFWNVTYRLFRKFLIIWHGSKVVYGVFV
jgi:hypothetical protein